MYWSVLAPTLVEKNIFDADILFFSVFVFFFFFELQRCILVFSKIR